MAHKDRKIFKKPDYCPYKNNGWNPILCGFCPIYCENDGKIESEKRNDRTRDN